MRTVLCTAAGTLLAMALRGRYEQWRRNRDFRDACRAMMQEAGQRRPDSIDQARDGDTGHYDAIYTFYDAAGNTVDMEGC